MYNIDTYRNTLKIKLGFDWGYWFIVMSHPSCAPTGHLIG